MPQRDRVRRTLAALTATTASLAAVGLVAGCGSDAVMHKGLSEPRITIAPSPHARRGPPELSAPGRLAIIARDLVAYHHNNKQWPPLHSGAFTTLVNQQILHGGVVAYVLGPHDSMTVCFAKTDHSWAVYRSTTHRITATGSTGGCPRLKG